MDRSDAAPAAVPAIGHNNPPKTITEQLAESHAALLVEVEALAKRANDAPVIDGDEDKFAASADIAADASALFKRLDKTREFEKAPYLKGERDVDGFFNPHKARVDRIFKAMRQRCDDHNEAKRQAELKRQREAQAAAMAEAEARRREAEQAAQAGRIEDAMAEIEEATKAEAIAEAVAADAPKAADLTRVRTEGGVTASARTEWTHEITDFEAIPLDRLRPYLKRDVVEAAVRLFVKQGNRELKGVRIFEKATTQFRR